MWILMLVLYKNIQLLDENEWNYIYINVDYLLLISSKIMNSLSLTVTAIWYSYKTKLISFIFIS